MGVPARQSSPVLRASRGALPLLGLLCLAAGAVPATAARPLVLEDLWLERTVSDPQLSPDGEWVAYTLSTPDRATDSDSTDLWLVSWDGTERLQLTSTPQSEHSPRWSPDGRYIAFLSDRADPERGEQLWVLDRRGGEAQQRSRFDGEIGSYAWSPDGRQLVFSARVPRTPEADPERPAPIVVDRLQFKLDRRGYLGAERAHLFLLELASGAVRQLTDGPYEELAPAWSPDGAQIAFLSKRGAEPDRHDDWNVYLIEPQPGSTPRQLTSSPGPDGDPPGDWLSAGARFSADGRQLAFLVGGAPEDLWYGLLQIGAVDVRGGPLRLPTHTLDRNTLDPRWSADGRWLYFRLEDDRSMVLARVRLRDGRLERLTGPGGVVTEFDTGAGGRTVVVHTTTARPSELAAVEAGGLRFLTDHNAWVREVQLVEARPIEHASRDGQSVHGLLLTPPGEPPPGGWPALLRLHGGPVSQHQHEFDFAWQLFVAHGYAVIAPNPRGSSGRGYRFQRALFADWGQGDVADVLAAVDHVVAQGIADPARLGVGGWSYGAMLTNYVIASDRRFKAAVSGAGISNMLAGYGTDHYVREWETELGLPWENPEAWIRLSYPFLHADRIVTPTLFMGGSEDWNVPLIGSEQMYQALRRLGVPTQLVVYPGQAHWLARPSLRADRLQRALEWYARFLGHGAGSVAPRAAVRRRTPTRAPRAASARAGPCLPPPAPARSSAAG